MKIENRKTTTKIGLEKLALLIKNINHNLNNDIETIASGTFHITFAAENCSLGRWKLSGGVVELQAIAGLNTNNPQYYDQQISDVVSINFGGAVNALENIIDIYNELCTAKDLEIQNFLDTTNVNTQKRAIQLQREITENGKTSLTMLVGGVDSPLTSFSGYSRYLTGTQCAGSGVFAQDLETERFHYGEYSRHFQSSSMLDIDIEKSDIQEVTDIITERVVMVREWVRDCKSNAMVETTTIPLENITE